MKHSALVILCCATLVAACDQPEQNKSDSQPAKTAAVATDVTEQSPSNMENMLETARQAASDLADSADDMVADTGNTELVVASADSDTDTGKTIYSSRCFACHGTGAAGAPKVGDKAAWEVRIAQGNDVLTKHAIEGYQGAAGFMPARGGYSNLSDDEVRQAVLYMVSQSQ